MDQPFLVHVQDRADDPWRKLLDAAAELIGDLFERTLLGERGRRQLLERAQLLGLADIAEQAEHLPDLAARIAMSFDERGDPDLVAMLVLQEQFLLGPAGGVQALLKPRDGAWIEMWTGQQLTDQAPDRFFCCVAEHGDEGGVHVDDPPLVIGDDDGAVAAIGHRVQQREALPLLKVAGDPSCQQHKAAAIGARRPGQRDADAAVAAIGALQRQLG